MKQRMRSGIVVAVAACAMLALGCGLAVASGTPEAGRAGRGPDAAGTGTASPAQAVRTLPYRRVRSGDYRNFLVNWDTDKREVLLAVIETPEAYATLFHPAPVMGDACPGAPPSGSFATGELVVVARVMDATDDPDGAFAVEGISAAEDRLTVGYRYVPPTPGATSTVKGFLAVWIPRGDWQSVSFLENGREAGELDLAGGQWSAPAVPVDTPPDASPPAEDRAPVAD